MTAEIELSNLIRGMKPQLQEGEYVFCSVPNYRVLVDIEPVCIFREVEGFTLIITKQQAEKFLIPYAFTAAWITLKIHSSLDAVGFTAAISKQLAMAGISCNVIAAYYHDHLFVRLSDAHHAIEILTAMAKNEEIEK